MSVRIYTPESKIRDLPALLREIVHGFAHGHYFAVCQFVEKLKSDVRTTMFGFLWNFSEPIVMAVIFVLLREGADVHFGEFVMPYSCFVFVGFFCFQTFIRTLTMPIGVIPESRALLKQAAIPPEGILLSAFMRAGFDACFGLVCVAGLLLFQGAFHFGGFILFIPILALIIVASFGLGLICAPFNAVYDDVGRMVILISRPLMFISPTFMVTEHPLLNRINLFNPLAVFMQAARDVLNSLAVHQGGLFAIWSLASLTLLLIGVALFHVSFPIIAQKA